MNNESIIDYRRRLAESYFPCLVDKEDRTIIKISPEYSLQWYHGDDKNFPKYVVLRPSYEYHPIFIPDLTDRNNGEMALYLTEGLFDALILHRYYGVSAIPLMGSSISVDATYFISNLIRDKNYSIISCFDNDSAGKKCSLHSARLLGVKNYVSTDSFKDIFDWHFYSPTREKNLQIRDIKELARTMDERDLYNIAKNNLYLSGLWYEIQNERREKPENFD
jgi:hypothetical protein